MIFDREDLTHDLLEQAAAEALTRPSDSSMWDERYYTTHGAVLDWAENASDLVAESNYLMVLAHLQDLAGEDADEHVIDGRLSHWAVGRLRQMFVQVRDEDGNFTLAFQEATAIAIALRDEYPVFDEQDHANREFETWWSNTVDAVRGTVDQGDDPEHLIEDAVSTLQQDGDVDYMGVPDREALTDAYRRARDAHYAALGSTYLNAQIEGQLSLGL